jgi:hypothetical protein
MTNRARFATTAALTAALVLPATADAKGPSVARITGPGLGAPVTINGDGEGGSATNLGLLVDQTGFFPQAFGQSPDPLLREQPAVRQLGARYTVTYTVPGPTTSTLRQDLYPYAAGTVISYMEPGQAIWDMQTHGGWYRGGALSTELRTMLMNVGLPKTPPAGLRSRNTSHVKEARIAVGAGAGLALTAGALFLLHRRRH